MRVGWRRFRELGRIRSSIARRRRHLRDGGARSHVAAHYAARLQLGHDRGLLGAALAPTDPAVMFSVLRRNREVGGRTGTILEGESGANDPVGIALMIAADESSARRLIPRHRLGHRDRVRRRARRRDSSSASSGAVGSLITLMQRVVAAAIRALYPIQDARRRAAVIYGVADGRCTAPASSRSSSSGILDRRRPTRPTRRAIERFHTSLASLAEIVGVRRARPDDLRPDSGSARTIAGSTGIVLCRRPRARRAAARRRLCCSWPASALRTAASGCSSHVERAEGRRADPARRRSLLRRRGVADAHRDLRHRLRRRRVLGARAGSEHAHSSPPASAYRCESEVCVGG